MEETSKFLSLKSFLSSAYASMHNNLLHDKRMDLLSDEVLALLPPSKNVLDIGCGDGKLIRNCNLKTDGLINFRGVEVFNRTNDPNIAIYDGKLLPYCNNSFDVCLLCDVLHHVECPENILSEAIRVSSEYIIIKDHLCHNKLDRITLMLMDFVGNYFYNVKSIYNYMNEEKWISMFEELNLKVLIFKNNVSLYSFPLSTISSSGLHCIFLLKVCKDSSSRK